MDGVFMHIRIKRGMYDSNWKTILTFEIRPFLWNVKAYVNSILLSLADHWVALSLNKAVALK